MLFFTYFPAQIPNASWCRKRVKNPSPWKWNTLWGKHDGSGRAGTNIPRVSFISHTTSIYLDFFPSESLLFLHRRLKQLSPFLPRCSPAPACSPGGPSWMFNPCQAAGLEQPPAASSNVKKKSDKKAKVTPWGACLALQTGCAIWRVEVNNRSPDVSPNPTWVQRASVPLGLIQNLCSAQD